MMNPKISPVCALVISSDMIHIYIYNVVFLLLFCYCRSGQRQFLVLGVDGVSTDCHTADENTTEHGEEVAQVHCHDCQHAIPRY